MSGSYNLTITYSVTGCTSLASIVPVIVNPTPTTPVVGNNSPLCPGDSLILNAPTITGIYYWTGPTSYTSTVQNPTRANVSIAMVGTYTLVVTINGCASFPAITTVTVNSCEDDELFFPKGFSPNADGTNDFFVIKGLNSIKYPGNHLTIFNRWGNKVYEATDYENNWDGIANTGGLIVGQKVPSGTYYYIFDLNKTNKKPMCGFIIIKY